MRFILLVLFLLGQMFDSHCQVVKGRDEVIFLKTSFGKLTILLYDQTPLHKANFIKLVRQGYYKNTGFHRIILQFMIQGGDPNTIDTIRFNDGLGGPAYTLPAEFNKNLKHVYGAVAAARMGDQINPAKASSGSQFYIVQNHEGTPYLDGSYTVFGQVVDGLSVIDTIAAQPKDLSDRPLKKVSVDLSIKNLKKKRIVRKYNCQEFYTR